MKIILLAPNNLSMKTQLSLDRAPRIRAYNMLKALKGISDVYCISGDYNERNEKYQYFFREEDINDYEGLYMETSNWPLRVNDYKFLKYCKNKIPQTVFYRDCYWKTTDYLKEISLKKIQSYVRFFIEFRLFNYYFDHFFVPTKSFASFCNLKNYSTLPPAGDVRKIENRNNNDFFNIIFAGNKKNGYQIIYQIMKNILSSTNKIKLHIVSTDIPRRKIKNVYYYHSGLYENTELLEKSHLGIIPREKNYYHDFSFPLKLMDYLSWGLPVISTNTAEVEQFITENEVGISVKHSATEFTNAILDLMNDDVKYNRYKVNALNTIRDKDNWQNRAVCVVNKLRELKK